MSKPVKVGLILIVLLTLFGGALLLFEFEDRGVKFELAVSPELIVGALLFSFLLGALAGVLPARGAAKLPPVEALRYE